MNEAICLTVSMKSNNYKNEVVDILVKSFADNKSVNYIIKQDNKRLQRIKGLMEYSFEQCRLFGKIYFSDDGSTCALIIYPDKKKTTFKSVYLDIKLILQSTGFSNISKAIKREAEIKKHHPQGPLCYLWFIGVEPTHQNKGFGTRLMEKIISDASVEKRTVCLETSTDRNIPWYKKLGFEIYKELDFGYKLYCMKKD